MTVLPRPQPLVLMLLSLGADMREHGVSGFGTSFSEAIGKPIGNLGHHVSTAATSVTTAAESPDCDTCVTRSRPALQLAL